MARRYVRDNRGRFASTGATARGGRLRTAAGNKRATVTMQGPARAGTIGKPAGLRPGALAARRAAAAKPAAAPAAAPKRRRTAKPAAPAKPAGRTLRSGVDAAKVERILKRVQDDRKPEGKWGSRKQATKTKQALDTRARAAAYLVKAGGATNVKVKGQKVIGDYSKVRSRERMVENIASKLSGKQIRRSTKRSLGSPIEPVSAKRTKARKQRLADQREFMKRYGGGRGGIHGTTLPTGRKGTLQALPRRVAEAAGTPQFYSNGNVNQTGMAGFYQHGHKPRTRGRFELNRSDVFGGRTSLRTRAAATQAYRQKVAGVGKLAGTARLGNATSVITRGKAKQLTLAGTTATSYGKPKLRRNRPRRAG